MGVRGLYEVQLFWRPYVRNTDALSVDEARRKLCSNKVQAVMGKLNSFGVLS